MRLSRRDVLKHAITSSALTLMPLSLLANQQKQSPINSQNSTNDINLVVPDTVSHGEMVPVHVSTELHNVQSISLFVDNNSTPLAAEFKMFDGLKADFKVPVNIERTSKITAVVKTTQGFYSAQARVNVKNNASQA